MDQPLVSVVVPVYNVDHLLPTCLDSLLAQTHRPLEIIVVDDGSTDSSAEVMRRYAAAHPEVHTVLQRHRGLGPARNAALSVAEGEYVTMVDADDWLEPTFVADTVRIARETGAEVVIGNFCFEVKGITVPFPFLPRRTSFTGEEAAELSINMSRLPAFAWSKLYRRELFHTEDSPFPSIFYEDLATTPRILARAGRVALTRRVYYHYCLRSDSIIGAFRVRNVFSFAAAIDVLRHDLYEQGRWEAWQPSYRRLLRQASVMMPAQVLFQRNEIPLRVRLPLIRRYLSVLRSLTDPPTDGNRLRPVRFRRPGVRGSTKPGVTSAALTVSRRAGAGPGEPRDPVRNSAP
jgi:glycosyltransferase involved in cell wall biosynthesis